MKMVRRKSCVPVKCTLRYLYVRRKHDLLSDDNAIAIKYKIDYLYQADRNMIRDINE